MPRYDVRGSEPVKDERYPQFSRGPPLSLRFVLGHEKIGSPTPRWRGVNRGPAAPASRLTSLTATTAARRMRSLIEWMRFMEAIMTNFTNFADLASHIAAARENEDLTQTYEGAFIEHSEMAKLSIVEAP